MYLTLFAQLAHLTLYESDTLFTLGKHPKAREWLARHRHWTFHFRSTSASWLNAVAGFFAKLTRQHPKRGVFRSLDGIKGAINRFLANTNADPKPFVWTADPKRVLAGVKRWKQTLESVH